MLKKLVGFLIVGLFLAAPIFATDFNRGNYDVRLKRVEFDSRYYLGLDGYYSVGQKLIDDKCKEENEALKLRTVKLEAQIELLIQLVKGGTVAKPENPKVPNPKPEPTDPTTPVTPTTPPPEPENPPDELEGTVLDGIVYEIFSTKCAKCHDESKKSGGLQLINTANKTLVLHDLPDRVEIWDRVFGVDLAKRNKSSMPKGGPQMDDKSVESIRLWMIEESDRLRKPE